MTEQLENYLAIESILELEPAADPFGGIRTDQIESIDQAEAAADALRDHWSLGIHPISSMTGLLESKGIKVIEAELPERLDGLACTVKLVRDQPDTQAVVVSRHSSFERRRFTLAHELAHRVLLGVASPALTLEKAMHRFAAAFLVPAEHLRAQVGGDRRGFTYGEIVRLKHVYGIAASAMLLRLRDVGILSPQYVSRAFRTYARTWRKDEPDPIVENQGLGAFEKPQRFESLVWRGLGEQLFSPFRGAELLQRPLHEIEEAIRGPSTA